MALSDESPHLTGRELEQAAVLNAFSDPSVRAVAFLGPAGIGKTRLATAILASLTKSGVRCESVSGRATDRSIPMLPLRHLTGDLQEATDPVAAVHLRLGLGPSAPGPGDPVLLIDDAQLLDDRSLSLITLLLDARRVRLLITIRTDDQPLPASVTGLLRSDSTERITLGRLTDHALVSIATDLLDGPLDGRTAKVLVEAAAGNPLLLRELIIAARSGGTLTDHGGLWVMSGPIPSTVVLDDLVARRLEGIGIESRNALELIVVGGPLRVGLLTTTTAPISLELLESAGLIMVRDASAEVGDFIVDVAHPIYRDVLSHQMRAMARLRCHRQLAELSEAITDPTPDEQLQTAVWRLLGGAPMPPTQTLDAARRAAALKDPVLAGDLAVASYSAEATADAAILACWCLATTGRQAEAEALAMEAQGTITDPVGQTALVLRRAEERWWWANDTSGAHAILDAGESDLPAGPWIDLLRAQRSVFAALNGDARDARGLAEPFLDSPLKWVSRTARIGYAFGLGLNDQWFESTTVSDKAFNDALADPDQSLSGDPSVHLVSRLYAALSGPDCTGTYELTRSIYDIALQQPSTQARGWAALILAMTQTAVGLPQSAARAAREGELLWSDAQVEGLARWCATALGLALLDLGDTTGASEVADRIERYRIDGFRLNEAHEHRLRAGLLAGRGELVSAARVLRQGASHALGRQAAVHAAECVHDLVRLGCSITRQDIEPLRSFTGPFVSAIVDLADATAEGDANKAETSARSFEAMGRFLHAAEAWTAAGALQPDSKRADATRCMAAAAEARRRCENPRTPLLAGRAPTDKLSGREREIARLAAEGLTNREVADRLVVSERTVESHLYRVFAKLGVSSRTELAALVDR